MIQPDFLKDRLSHCEKHMSAWHLKHSDTLPTSVLEIGTGWYPVVPMGLLLSGLDSLTTIDPYPHLRKDLILEIWTHLHRCYQDGSLETLLPGLDWERGRALLEQPPSPESNVDALLEQWGMTYMVEDARQMSIETNSIDLIISNNTFEHIPQRILEDIVPELKRILRPEGIMSHYIDMADHYSYVDTKISPYHFLQFTEQQWGWIENKLQSQNRMRVSQYRSLFQNSGFDVLKEENESDDVSILDHLRLKVPFQNMSKGELGVTYSHMICQHQ